MKTIVLLMLLLLSHGCALKKFAIDHADNLITHQVNKRLPLNTEQEQQLDKDVDRFLNDSKPLAREILKILKEVSFEAPEKLEDQYSQLEKDYVKIAANFSAMVSRPMARLDKEQQKSFFKRLKEEQKRVEKQQNEDDRKKRFQERFKFFLGSMNSSQEKLLSEYEEYFKERSGLRISRRMDLSDKLKTIFEKEVPLEMKEELITEAFKNYQKESLTGNKNLEMLKKLIPTLSTEQKDHFKQKKKEIQGLLEYFILKTY